jgi:hypothetical protein
MKVTNLTSIALTFPHPQPQGRKGIVAETAEDAVAGPAAAAVDATVVVVTADVADMVEVTAAMAVVAGARSFFPRVPRKNKYETAVTRVAAFFLASITHAYSARGQSRVRRNAQTL